MGDFFYQHLRCNCNILCDIDTFRDGQFIFQHSLYVHFNGFVHIGFRFLASLSCRNTTWQIGTIRRVISTCLFNNNKKAIHILLPFTFFRLFQLSLFQNAIQSAWSHFVARMTSNCDATWLLGMFLLSVTALRRDHIPSICFNEFDDVSNFHAINFSTVSSTEFLAVSNQKFIILPSSFQPVPRLHTSLDVRLRSVSKLLDFLLLQHAEPLARETCPEPCRRVLALSNQKFMLHNSLLNAPTRTASHSRSLS